jgi:hypothetical protein
MGASDSPFRARLHPNLLTAQNEPRLAFKDCPITEWEFGNLKELLQ